MRKKRGILLLCCIVVSLFCAWHFLTELCIIDTGFTTFTKLPLFSPRSSFRTGVRMDRTVYNRGVDVSADIYMGITQAKALNDNDIPLNFKITAEDFVVDYTHVSYTRRDLFTSDKINFTHQMEKLPIHLSVKFSLKPDAGANGCGHILIESIEAISHIYYCFDENHIVFSDDSIEDAKRILKLFS